MSADFPVPERTALSAPYWQGLEEGRLLFQRCDHCGHAWLPPRAECPNCLAAEWSWQRASGRGRIVSWVVYHRVYHPAFADKVPYNVALVALDEGPRLLTNILDPGGQDRLGIDRPVVLAIERQQGIALARFRLAGVPEK